MIIPTLEAVSDYIIYFDKSRVDRYVTNFSTQISINGQIGQASIQMLPIPEFYENIKPMTVVRIFVKNVFSGNYFMVFEGEIRSRTRLISHGNDVLQFVAQDYLTWLNTVPVPILLGTDAVTNSLIKFSWAAQNIDVKNTDFFKEANKYSFEGKNLETIVSQIVNDLYKGNSQFANTNSVAHYVDLKTRIKVMADIDETLAKQYQYFSLIFQGVEMQNLYVMLNNVASKLMFELFQDRDGIIRVKPPYWDMGVMKNHILDPMIITEINENINYDQQITRVVVQGGTNMFNEQAARAAKDQGIYIPIGAYFGDGTFISDQDIFKSGSSSSGTLKVTARSGLNIRSGAGTGYSRLGAAPSGAILNYAGEEQSNWYKIKYGSITGWCSGQYLSWVSGGPDSSGGGDSGGSGGGTSSSFFYNLNQWSITSAFGRPRPSGYHHGTDWGLPSGTAVCQQGPSGVVEAIGYREIDGYYVKVKWNSGGLDGYTITYRHLMRGGTSVSTGQTVGPGQQIALSDNTGSSSTGPHLHVEVNNPSGGFENPGEFLPSRANSGSGSSSNDKGPPPTLAGDYDKLRKLTDAELATGVKVLTVDQPLISKATGGDQSIAYNLLNQYASYIYNYTNAVASTASVTTIAAPWIRPGFNVWVDPVRLNRIYYVNSVSHRGSAGEGVYTSLGLSYSRPVPAVAVGNDKSNAVKIEHARADMNSFYKVDHYGPHRFGTTLETDAEFNAACEYSVQWNTKDRMDYSTKAVDNSFLRYFYIDTPMGPIDGQYQNNFSVEVTPTKINELIYELYSNAPDVVKQRANKMIETFDSVVGTESKYFLASTPW